MWEKAKRRRGEDEESRRWDCTATVVLQAGITRLCSTKPMLVQSSVIRVQLIHQGIPLAFALTGQASAKQQQHNWNSTTAESYGRLGDAERVAAQGAYLHLLLRYYLPSCACCHLIANRALRQPLQLFADPLTEYVSQSA